MPLSLTTSVTRMPPKPPCHFYKLPNELTLSIMERIAVNSPRDLYSLTNIYQPAYALFNSILGLRLVQAIPEDPIVAEGEMKSNKACTTSTLNHLRRLAEGKTELERLSRWYEESQHSFGVDACRLPTRHERLRPRFQIRSWRLEDEIEPAFRRLMWVVNRLENNKSLPGSVADEREREAAVLKRFLCGYLDGWFGDFGYEQLLIMRDILYAFCGEHTDKSLIASVDQLARRNRSLNLLRMVGQEGCQAAAILGAKLDNKIENRRKVRPKFYQLLP
ncbi:hypothetical protein LTR78_007994 [Recurvomyces mirabilis]|uniref:Uncharacterized protein n=1 Tax=Recurvomyces mirabilis TaxID=574656 RepID=A0AAE0TU47_9PEZI|nr:hypothetical protein LTR78_007994 [Recurvomyces mirabilis]KAK5150722.1 hypothetical protein LTS14_009784 [Recurvomyces mirabilis]